MCHSGKENEKIKFLALLIYNDKICHLPPVIYDIQHVRHKICHGCYGLRSKDMELNLNEGIGKKEY